MEKIYIVRRTPDGFVDHVTVARLDEIKQTIDELKKQPKYQGSHWWVEVAPGRYKLDWDDEPPRADLGSGELPLL